MEDETHQDVTADQLSAGEFLDSHVVVTGAAGVIGGWIADAFASAGAHLLLSDLRSEKVESEIASGRFRAAASIRVHRTDLRDDESLAELGTMVMEEWGAPDVVVNNAGIYPRDRMLDADIAKWRAILDINVIAPYYLIARLAGLMVERRRTGAVVNITSGAAVTVQPGGVPYSVSKAALTMLTRGAALELAPYGIRVNAVAPGFTPGSDLEPKSDEAVAHMVETIPLGRTAGPRDAAEAVLYLASTRSSFVTGTTLTVDGGRTAGR